MGLTLPTCRPISCISSPVRRGELAVQFGSVAILIPCRRLGHQTQQLQTSACIDPVAAYDRIAPVFARLAEQRRPELVLLEPSLAMQGPRPRGCQKSGPCGPKNSVRFKPNLMPSLASGMSSGTVSRRAAEWTCFVSSPVWYPPPRYEKNGDVMVTWNVGEMPCTTMGHVFTDKEFRSLSLAAGLSIEKTFVVEPPCW